MPTCRNSSHSCHESTLISHFSMTNKCWHNYAVALVILCLCWWGGDGERNSSLVSQVSFLEKWLIHCTWAVDFFVFVCLFVFLVLVALLTWYIINTFQHRYSSGAFSCLLPCLCAHIPTKSCNFCWTAEGWHLSRRDCMFEQVHLTVWSSNDVHWHA